MAIRNTKSTDFKNGFVPDRLNYMTKTTPLCLIILDGWGLKTDPYGNAIISAQPGFYESLLTTYP